MSQGESPPPNLAHIVMFALPPWLHETIFINVHAETVQEQWCCCGLDSRTACVACVGLALTIMLSGQWKLLLCLDA